MFFNIVFFFCLPVCDFSFTRNSLAPSLNSLGGRFERVPVELVEKVEEKWTEEDVHRVADGDHGAARPWNDDRDVDDEEDKLDLQELHEEKKNNCLIYL